MWSVASSNTIINLLILASMYVQISKHIMRSLRHSLEKGMRKYLSDNVWKVTFDRIQYNFECCGIDNYNDWHKTAWLTTYHINENSELVKESVSVPSLSQIQKLNVFLHYVTQSRYIKRLMFLQITYVPTSFTFAGHPVELLPN